MDKKDRLLINNKIASKLYQARCDCGLKQSDLENEGVISQSQLSKVENSELTISAVTLFILAKRYGKNMNYFFE